MYNSLKDRKHVTDSQENHSCMEGIKMSSGTSISTSSGLPSSGEKLVRMYNVLSPQPHFIATDNSTRLPPPSDVY